MTKKPTKNNWENNLKKKIKRILIRGREDGFITPVIYELEKLFIEEKEKWEKEKMMEDIKEVRQDLRKLKEEIKKVA